MKKTTVKPQKTEFVIFLVAMVTSFLTALLGWALKSPGLLALCIIVFAVSVPVTLFVLARDKFRTLTYTVNSFNVRGTEYKYSDIDAVEIMGSFRRARIQYGIYVKGQCIYTYDDSFINREEFNKKLESRGVRFMH